MSDFQSRTSKLAELMKEFSLSEAALGGENWKIAFRKPAAEAPQGNGLLEPANGQPEPSLAEPAPPVRQGTPISSPMTGIYYSASSPSSPPFVREGDTVDVGQVVALIEAMKVFNEITSSVAGRVLSLTAENGALVSPGEPIMYIG